MESLVRSVRSCISTAEVAEDPELDQRFRAGPLLLESSVFSWPPFGHRPSALLICLRVYQVVAHFGFEHDEESCGGCNAEACSFPCVSPPGGGSSDCRGSKFPQEAMPFYCSELRSKGVGWLCFKRIPGGSTFGALEEQRENRDVLLQFVSHFQDAAGVVWACCFRKATAHNLRRDYYTSLRAWSLCACLCTLYVGA